MLDLRELWDECHKINSKTIEGDTRYYKDNTDTCASVSIGDIDYHYFDGSDRALEWLKNFFAFRFGAYGSHKGYDGTAKDLFDKMCEDMSISRKQVFVGYSRGGAIALLVLLRHSLMCYRRGVKPRAELVTFCAPKAGHKKLYKQCEKMGFQHTRVVMVGDIVPKIVWWWCDMWTTRLIKLKNSEKGKKAKHKNVGEYL